MPEESPQREDSSPEVQRNGRALERSRSPVRPSEHRRRKSRSPVAGETQRRRSTGENEEREGRHHHHHHHHHRKRHRSPDKETQFEKAETQPRDRSATPETGQPVDDKPKDIPTGPRGYRSRQRYRPESNYGRLGYDVEYHDDERDDEDRLREVERRRDEGREKEEPKVTFKGRGAMKFRERNY